MIYRMAAVCLGLFLTALILEVGLRIGGCLIRREPYRAQPETQGAGFVIVCAGDSHTEGVGAPRGEDYPSQLRALLNASDPERGYQVVNVGRAGNNSTQAVNRLLAYLKSAVAKPDLVIFCAGANNDHNLSEARFLPKEVAKMGFSMRLNFLLAESRAYRLSQNTLKRIRRLLKERKDESTLTFDDLLNIRRGDELRLLEDWIYDDIAVLWRTLRSRGIGLLLINYFHWTTPVDGTFLRASKDFQIPFLDVRNFGDPFYKYFLNERGLVAPNFHPNQYGYARIAEMVYNALKKQHLIPLPGEPCSLPAP